ncbi:MAG: hypothetical protein HMLKMBBP_02127 [Planctomycetes bacterium]|nr:hypothetical protein [Planctomycetota bacterium]
MDLRDGHRSPRFTLADDEFVRRAVLGDPECHRELRALSVTHLARRRRGRVPRDDVEDVVSDAIVRVGDELREGRCSAPAKSYAKALERHAKRAWRASDRARKSQSSGKHEEPETAEDPPNILAAWETAFAVHAAMSVAVASAMKGLGDGDYELLRRHHDLPLPARKLPRPGTRRTRTDASQSRARRRAVRAFRKGVVENLQRLVAAGEADPEVVRFALGTFDGHVGGTDSAHDA